MRSAALLDLPLLGPLKTYQARLHAVAAMQAQILHDGRSRCESAADCPAMGADRMCALAEPTVRRILTHVDVWSMFRLTQARS